MRKIILLIVCFNLAFAEIFGQQTQPPVTQKTNVEMGNYYLKKSKKQLIWGSIIAGVGVGILVTGLVKYGKDEWIADQEIYYEEFKAITIVGAGIVVASMPLLFSSAKNKGRAEILLQNEKGPVGYLPNAPANYPAVGIRFLFSK